MATEEKVVKTPYDERIALLEAKRYRPGFRGSVEEHELWSLMLKQEGYKAGRNAEVKEHSERCQSANCPCLRAGVEKVKTNPDLFGLVAPTKGA